MTCTHTKTRTVWVDDTTWYDDEEHGHYEEETYSTEDDLDLHRTRCSQCGHIGYYSGAARQYYENGVKSPGIKGLE
jgi:uncharacterized OB-fold protein